MAYKDPEKKRECQRRWAQTHRMQTREANKRYKQKHAEAIKLAAEQYREKNRERLREESHRYCMAHREEACARGLEWYFAHYELCRERRRLRYSAEEKERNRLYAANHKVECRERLRHWRANNREKTKQQDHRRRARLLGASGFDYTTAQHIVWRMAMWGNRCSYCGGPYEAIDHQIPLAKGGTHWPANLRPSCKRCNSIKGDKTIAEFREYLQRLQLVKVA